MDRIHLSAGLVPALLSLALALAPMASAIAAETDILINAAQQRAAGIETAALRSAQTAQRQGLPARVVVPNPQMRMLSAPLAGLVEQVFVATEQSVRAGQRLARLQSPALADAQHTYLQAVSRSELERANLERAESLFEAGVIPERQLLAARAEFAEVSIDLAERTQALRMAGMSDESMTRLRGGRSVGTAIDLHAPIDGVVIEQLAVVGQRVEAAAPLLRLARLDPLWLEIQVPVARLAGVATGAAVRVEGTDIQGRVLAIGRNVAPGSQTALVRAEIGRGADRLRPGQMVEATLTADTAVSQWELPNAAVVRVGGRALVFVATASGFRPVPVRIVGEASTRSLVSADLPPEARVAVAGVASLKAAMLGIGVD